jgi:lipopolysaccharide/colanic/teichoic acid biosynthesis glycosyltransferase
MQTNFAAATQTGFNYVLAAFLVITLAPLLLFVAIIIKNKLGSPVFYVQQRPGLHSKPFYLIKFRTMSDKRDEQGNLLPDEERLTSLGKLLRKTSLDELPELFNVLKGDMNLVGPRPLLMQYLPYFKEREKLRFSVRPGITGWAQINGRNFLPWDERLAMDAWYVENRSIKLDLKILALTVLKVIRREDVAPDSEQVESYLDQERQNNTYGVTTIPKLKDDSVI